MRKFKWILFTGLASLNILVAQYKSPERGFVFDDKSIARVDIEIDQDSLDQILDPNNVNSNYEYPATFTFTRGDVSESVENVGFRLRGNTSRVSGKKSFKISFNTFESGRKYHGIEKMNLNGEHNDPSILRSKACWDFYDMAGIMSARSNHVLLYINEEFKGIYINVEHIDEEFIRKRLPNPTGNLYKCLYPADLKYLGDYHGFYKEEIYGRRPYDLKTNKEEDNYRDLANFIDILNNYNGEDFKCQLESVFDVENYLKAIVWDILVTNWDGPIVNKNNFYLYNDVSTGRFVYIPYDLDNTFGIGWGGTDWAQTNIYDWPGTWGNEARPIYDNLMAIKEYRDKVSYYFNYFIENFFNEVNIEPYFDFYKSLISPYRADDVYAGYDYGWDYDDFMQSYYENVGNHVNYGLLDFVKTRSASVLNQLELNSTLPIIEKYGVKQAVNKVEFNAELFWPYEAIGEVKINYQFDNGAWNEMTLSSDDSFNYSSSVNIEDADSINYYFTSGNFGGQRNWPYCDFKTLYLSDNIDYGLVINEFLASNDNGVVDEFNENEDWIELYNRSDNNLIGYKFYLTDDQNFPNKWEVPLNEISARSYHAFYADNDTEQGSLHANFKLSKDGEYLGLYVQEEDRFFVIDEITFPSQTTDVSYGRLPNGTGSFQTLPYPTFNYSNEGPSKILEIENLSNIHVSPNPATAYFIVQSNNESISHLRLYNLQGHIVMDKKIGSNIHEFIYHHDFDIIPGVYFLEIVLKNGHSRTEKIVFIR